MEVDSLVRERRSEGNETALRGRRSLPRREKRARPYLTRRWVLATSLTLLPLL